MKKFFLFAANMVLVASAYAQVTLPFYDGFNYTTGGDLTGNGSWAGSASATIKVNAANLNYSGLQSAVGNDVSLIPGSSAARTYVNFTSQTSGTVYFSFLLKVNTLPSAQRLIAYSYSTTSSTSTPYLGFFVTSSGQLAVGISTSTPQFTSSGLTAGSANLIVVAYTFGTSDSAQIWISPTSLGGSAPATTANFTATGTHNSSLAYFHWSTPSAGTGGGSYEVDELRIGSTYAAVTPTGGTTPSATVPYITQALLTPQGFALRGTNGPASSAYQVLCSTNVGLLLNQWSPIATNSFDDLGRFDCTNPPVAGDAQRYYRLKVGGTNPPAETAPTIITQPQSQSVVVGQTVLFSVTANGAVPLTYQWYFNTNTPLASGTNATLVLNNVQTNDAGGYSVVVTNHLGAITSVVALLTVSDVVGGATNVFPVNGAVNVCVDAPLKITFDTTPTLGASGLIRIYNAGTLALHDSIDLSASSPTKTIGGTSYRYYPVLISGSAAFISPHLSLAYGQSYYVNIDSNVFQNAGSWSGISGTNSWRFTTRPSAPASGTTNIIVAADGSGDFCTVQGAIDFVPSGNTTPRTIQIQNGVYREIVNNNNRNNLTFAGQSRNQTLITYANNNNLNASSSTRPMFHTTGNDIMMKTLTLTNSTPQGGSQAEALRVDGLRFIFWNGELDSLQDTILVNSSGNQAYFQDCLVQGNVDYVWGLGTTYFTNCEIRSIARGSNPNGYICQPRNDAAHNGIAFVNCRITGSDNSFNSQYLARNNKNDATPASQTAFINCMMSANITPVGWLLDGTSDPANLRFWEYQSTDLTGTNLLDVSQRPSWSRQLTAAEAANVRDVSTWFSGWTPHVTP